MNVAGKKTESGGSLRIDKDEWVKAEHKSRKILALGLTLDICKSFFSWFPNCTSSLAYTYAYFYLTLLKVELKPITQIIVQIFYCLSFSQSSGIGLSRTF